MTLLYSVIQPFKAMTPISGRERQFQPGETFLYDTGQTGAIITIEVDKSLFLVDRSIFETCCTFKGESAPPFF